MKLTRQERREFVKLVKNAKPTTDYVHHREYIYGICFALNIILDRDDIENKLHYTAEIMQLNLERICGDDIMLPRAVMGDRIKYGVWDYIQIRNHWLYHWAETGEYLTVDRWKDRISLKKKLKRG